jgi:hypothetical protein
MFKRLLSTVANGQTGNTAELAAAIDATPAMIEALVSDLERRGLLQRAGECGSGCNACQRGSECDPKTGGGAWILTAAGRRYAVG